MRGFGEHPAEDYPSETGLTAIKAGPVAGSNPALGTTSLPATILDFGFWLKKEGYAEQSIERAVRVLRTLARKYQVPIENPEAVKEALTRLQWSPASKRLACDWLTTFYRMRGTTWTLPRYQAVDKLPYIPPSELVDSLIGACSRSVATFLQFLRETGVRRSEAFNIQWRDLDLERGTATITPEKGSRARLCKLSPRLVSVLGALPKDRKYVWGDTKLDHFQRTFQRQRKRLATRLNDPRIGRISFHTLRHLKGTLEYAKSHDIVYVQRLLGHKSISNTLKYVQLVQGMAGSEDFTCKVARTLDEASGLIEAGFDYVTELDGVKLFRKRK